MTLLVNGYIRCSTDEQEESGLGLEAQRSAIRSWCKLRGLSEPDIIEDPAESGASPLADRPGGAELLRRVEAGNCVVVVMRLDRLFRSSSDATATIDRWTSSKVMLSSISESFDMTTATGRFIARTFANFAELERELISERTKSAMKVLIERGQRVTRDPRYGFAFADSGRKNGDDEPILIEVPDQAEQDAIRLMRDMRRHGKSLREIAGELDRRGIKPRTAAAWSHSTVKGILDANRSRKLKPPSGSGAADAPPELPTPESTPR